MKMTLSRATFLFLGAASLLAITPAMSFAQPHPEPEAIMKKMMEATKSGAYDTFMADCDDKMRASLTKQMFDGVGGMLAPRLKEGWKHVYLGKLRQQGNTVHLWRLEFANGKDEMLLRLSLKDRKVSGIFVQ